MRVPLILLLGFFVASAAAAFSCYRATPNVYIQPPTFNSKLLLDELITCLDTTAGIFYINSTEYYADTNGAHLLPPVLLYGNLSFAAPQLMQFSYPNDSALYCSQARSSPPLCPLLQTYTNGPFVFSASPSLAAPQVLTLEASSTFYDPLTGAPYNFFYSPQPISLVCTSGSCASLANVVPPSPLPPDPVFTNVTVGILNATEVITPNDVRYYGAKCDGVTDDTAAFQAAANSVTALSISVPNGVCIISSTITVSVANKRLYGAGQQNSIIRTKASLANFIYQFTPLFSATRFTLEQLTLDSSAVPLSGARHYTANVAANYFTLTDCIVLTGYVRASGGANLYGTTIVGCTFDGSGLEYSTANSASATMVSNSRFFNQPVNNTGVSIHAAPGFYVTDTKITACDFDLRRYDIISIGVELWNVSGAAITGCSFQNSKMGVSVFGRNIAITGSTFTNQTQYSIEWAGDLGSITGCTFDQFAVAIFIENGTSSYSVPRIEITGNTFLSASNAVFSTDGYGIVAWSPVTDLEIGDNDFTDNLGIWVTKTCNLCSFVDNDLYSPSTTTTPAVINVQGPCSGCLIASNNIYTEVNGTSGTGFIYYSASDSIIANNLVISTITNSARGIAVVTGSGISTRVRMWNNFVNPNFNGGLVTISAASVSDTLLLHNVGSVSLGAGSFANLATVITVNNAPPSTGTWTIGDVAMNIQFGSAGILAWICSSSGSPGTWIPYIPTYYGNAISSNNGDANATLTPYSAFPIYQVTIPLTATRTITLSTTGATVGIRWRITRASSSTGTGFTLNVVGSSTLCILTTGQWCEVSWTFLSSYVVTAAGWLDGTSISSPSTLDAVTSVSMGTNLLGSGTLPHMTLDAGANCSSIATSVAFTGSNQWMQLSLHTGTGVCPGGAIIATLTFGVQPRITTQHACVITPVNTAAQVAGYTGQGTTTIWVLGSPAAGLLPNTDYLWLIGPCGGF